LQPLVTPPKLGTTLTQEELMPDLKGLRVAILATDGVEQAELTEPRKFLDQAGARTTLFAPKTGQIQAMQHSEKGDKIKVDQEISQADPADFEAVLLPGGVANADHLRMDEDARRFVRDMHKAGKPIAAICHAPWLLISAGLTKGRKMTSYFTLQDDLRNAGAHWTDQEVVRDEHWVTSRQPSDIPAFNNAIAELFKLYAKRNAA
jgi:protease I